MGKLLYGPQQRAIDVDDRALAHLKIVILAKLRRREAFAFSWENDRDSGGGRGTIWLDSAIPLEFVFHGSRSPSLNRAWIQAMNATAEHGDVRLVPEPDDGPSEQPASGTKGRW
jgi:hypothetical protein